MKEIWKPIKGYEGLYEICSNGDIVAIGMRGRRLLKGHTDKYGNNLVYLRDIDNNGKFHLRKKLIISHFIPEYSKYQTEFINGITCSVDNIRVKLDANGNPIRKRYRIKDVDTGIIYNSASDVSRVFSESSSKSFKKDVVNCIYRGELYKGHRFIFIDEEGKNTNEVLSCN